MEAASIDWFIPFKIFLEDRINTAILETDPTFISSLGGKVYKGEFLSIEEAIDYWRKNVEALEVKPYKGGGHFGDCTQFPITCTRCYVDSERDEAMYLYNMINRLSDGGWPSEIYEESKSKRDEWLREHRFSAE